MKAVKLEAGKYAEIVEIDADLKSLQEAVGGLIDVVTPFKRKACIVVNDEGKVLGLPLNRALKWCGGKVYDIIAGPAYILGDTGEGEFCSLSDRDAEHYRRMFRNPEAFVRQQDGSIAAWPCTTEVCRTIMHMND